MWLRPLGIILPSLLFLAPLPVWHKRFHTVVVVAHVYGLVAWRTAAVEELVGSASCISVCESVESGFLDRETLAFLPPFGEADDGGDRCGEVLFEDPSVS